MKVDVYTKRSGHVRYDSVHEIEFEPLREGPTDLLHLWQAADLSGNHERRIVVEITGGDKFSVVP